MSDFTYNSDINSGSLMIRETRVIAGLMLQNISKEQWKHEIEINNLLQKPSRATALRHARALRKRLMNMPVEFLTTLCNSDNELATQTAFAAVLDSNLLLLEFMESIVFDAYTTQSQTLESYQWLDFINDCSNKDSKLKEWKSSTSKKMGQVVFRMLAEVGYLQSTKTKKLQAVILRAELTHLLEKFEKQRIKRCMKIAYKANA